MKVFKFDKVNWRWKVRESIAVYTGIHGYQYSDDYMTLQRDGTLKLTDRYAWDGATMAIDDGLELASACHDALYQLLRKGVLPPECRREADRLLYDLALNQGVPKFRASYIYAAVRLLGWRYARKAN